MDGVVGIYGVNDKELVSKAFLAMILLNPVLTHEDGIFLFLRAN